MTVPTIGAHSRESLSIEEVRLVDHHCHGVTTKDLDRESFEQFLTEGFDRPPTGTNHLQTPLGLALRRWCSPIIGLEPHSSAEEYMEARNRLGGVEASRRFLKASGVDIHLVDSGYRPEEILSVAELGSLSQTTCSEIVRLEAVAERVAQGCGSAGNYAAEFESSLQDATRDAVGLKTIVAYRGGFDFDPSPPSRELVIDAAGKWLRARQSGPQPLRDTVLLRHCLWIGAEIARQRHLPIQVHAGFGDPDLKLHLANPSLMTDLIKAFAPLDVNLVFLHCYPYHREAAYLASVFPNVYFDVGLAINYTGASSRDVLAESMELAPFTKQLFSSDAFGLAELHYLGAMLYRNALRAILDSWLRDSVCSLEDAQQIEQLVGRENAVRLYPIRTGQTQDSPS